MPESDAAATLIGEDRIWQKRKRQNAGPRTRRVNRILLTVVVVLGVVAIAAAIVFIVILSGAVLHS